MSENRKPTFAEARAKALTAKPVCAKSLAEQAAADTANFSTCNSALRRKILASATQSEVQHVMAEPDDELHDRRDIAMLHDLREVDREVEQRLQMPEQVPVKDEEQQSLLDLVERPAPKQKFKLAQPDASDE